MKRVRQIFFLVVTVLVLFSAAVYGDTWNPKKRLTYTYDNSWFPAIAISGSNIFVVWKEDTQEKEGIHFKRSVDGGLNWKPAKKISTNDSGFHPAIASEGSNVYVVWVDSNYETNNIEIYLRRSIDKGVNWKPTKKLAYGTFTLRDPAIAVNGSQIYVVWVDLDPYEKKISFKRSVDGGATWKATKTLATNAQDFSEPAIAVDSSNVYVVWHSISGKINFKRSVDGGVTWKTEISVTEGLTGNPGLAIDGSNIYVVWTQLFGAPKEPEIYFKRSANRGVTWTANKRLTNTAGVSWHPAIAVDGTNVCVVWLDDTSEKEGIYYKRSVDRGATWTAYKRLSKYQNPFIFPVIAVNGSNIYVVWSENPLGDYDEVYIKKGVMD